MPADDSLLELGSLASVATTSNSPDQLKASIWLCQENPQVCQYGVKGRRVFLLSAA
jgi:hypothetical protein